jgi:hypothetical protein
MARKPLLNEMAMPVDVDGWWWCCVEGPHLLTFIYVANIYASVEPTKELIKSRTFSLETLGSSSLAKEM